MKTSDNQPAPRKKANPAAARQQPVAGGLSYDLDRRLAGAWRLLAVPLLIFIAFPVMMLFLGTSPARILESLQMQQVYR